MLADGGRYNALQLQAEGEPVEWVAPTEGALSWVCGLGITSKAENIDAAYKLINYFVSPPAQAIAAQNGFAIVNPAAVAKVPARVPRDRRPALDLGRDRRGPARELPDLGPRLAGGAGRVSTDGAAIAEARDLLAELVDIPSPSGSEGRIVDRIEELCGEWSLPVLRVRSETGRDSLVVGAPEEPALALVAHVDTIAPPWAGAGGGRRRHRPRPRLGGRQGRRRRLPARRPRAGRCRRGSRALGVAFAFPVDEERGGSGSRTVALELAPARAIALEATGLRAGVVEMRRHRRLGPRRGRSAHGALTDVGRERDPRGRRADHRAAALGLDAPRAPAARRVAGRGRRDPGRHRVQHGSRPLQLPAADPARAGPGRRRDPRRARGGSRPSTAVRSRSSR